jgi:two-component system, sensor histidine kinase and response regulator
VKNQAAILVVDDDEDFLSYAQKALEADGYAVQCASTAAEAAAQLRARRFELVVSDLMLAGATGLEVLEQARRIDPLSVGIVVTGHSSVDSAMQALREGAYDYLVKPCSPDQLAAATKRAVEHYRLKQALIHKTSELEKLETQLSHRATMIANVSHELKNPLSVVYGYSAFLLSQGEDAKPEDVQRGVKSIHKNAQQLTHLLEELIDSVRLSSHKVELDRKPIDAMLLCREAVENAKLEAAKKGVDLACDGGDGLMVSVDRRRAQQILGNLLSNALKFTKAGGAILVSLARDGEAARFTVSDTGIGIPPEELSLLFERFYQSTATPRDQQGLGLGLDICRGLVELHGGRIWAESELGKGSAFHFTLPLEA